jgi:hypothetical protein
VDLAELLPSWLVTLRADRRSPSTVESYLIGVRRYLNWCRDNGHAQELTKPLVRNRVAEQWGLYGSPGFAPPPPFFVHSPDVHLGNLVDLGGQGRVELGKPAGQPQCTIRLRRFKCADLTVGACSVRTQRRTVCT